MMQVLILMQGRKDRSYANANVVERTVKLEKAPVLNQIRLGIKEEG